MPSLVRSGAESGQVVAVLQLPRTHPAREALRENAIADDEDIILRRVQFSDGRTRAFINDQPVSAGLLQAVGRLIVEIHGQHDDRALVDVATHRAALDAFGGHESLAAAVWSTHEALVEANAAVAGQRAIIAEAQAREEYARHVVAELGELHLEAGEEEVLAERRQRLMTLEKAVEEVRDADEILNGPTAPGPVLAGLMRRLMRKADAGAAVFQPIVEALDTALVSLDATSDALENLKRDMAFDPADLERSRNACSRCVPRPASTRRPSTDWGTSSPSTARTSRCCRAASNRSRHWRQPRLRLVAPTQPPLRR